MVVSEKTAGLVSFTQRQVDRVVPLELRQKTYAQTSDFAAERPVLFAFILAQLTFSLIPVLLFASFIVSTFLFAAGAAILFTLFWFGVSLAVLVPTLFVTGALGVGVWAWAVSSFILVRWLYGVLQGVTGGGAGGAGGNNTNNTTLQPFGNGNGAGLSHKLEDDMKAEPMARLADDDGGEQILWGDAVGGGGGGESSAPPTSLEVEVDSDIEEAQGDTSPAANTSSPHHTHAHTHEGVGGFESQRA
ncbi:hypothetical protein B0H63DRAFT_514242 [Podospora didyma]|uniref:Uncharacterized protein n=1 Tax=Podospora didyma TaxID=330526 RepID=A0AAE0N430_9PEZI|nr:hypothetical protein B0H63DRAFT_514242 [Podospora didyma]